VLIFDRQSQTWQALETPYFSGALWSPDGAWLVGQPIIHGDTTSNPLVLTSADGREWRYLLQDEEGFKSPLGWIDENQIVFLQTLDNVEPSFHAKIQVLDVNTGALTLLQDIFYEEGLNGPVLKPDGSQLAYAVDRSDPYRINLVDIPSGKVTTLDVPVAGSLDWSPDAQQLAITSASGYSCEIHVLQIGGQEDHKVFTGDWGGACIYTWSPDGNYILVGAYAQNPTVPRLYLVRVPDGETRLIELPEVGVEFEWPRPSWVP
jgi:Tol biopolymer transport system component